MIAAIYARKSTEQLVADEQKSVARQIANARAYAARKGWAVDDACIFVDDGISGAEFARRPAFMRMMNALKPRPPFQVLVMSEESRLGREAIETAYVLKQLVQAGVRVFFYLEDRERTLDSPTDKVLLSITAFADEMERARASQRSTDKAMSQARAGHVAGGRVFGYHLVDVMRNGERVIRGPDERRRNPRATHVERVINDTEADVVRRIFRLCADGHGIKAIAKLLNAEGAPSPRAQLGRSQTWAPSSVREVLNRDLYRGILAWNRSRKRDRWGVHRQTARPATDWIDVPAPHLAIVTDDEWRAAHARISAARAIYRNEGKAGGRPPLGTPSRYLLTNLALCGCCGGPMHVRSWKQGAGRKYFYACSGYHLRGKSVCSNKSDTPMADTDLVLIEALVDDVLDPGIIRDAVEFAIGVLRGDSTANPREPLERQLEAVRRQRRELLDAIDTGQVIGGLLEALQRLAKREAALTSDLQAIASPRRVQPADAARLRRELLTLADSWRQVLVEDAANARPIVTALLNGRVTIAPSHTLRKEWRMRGEGTLAGLFERSVFQSVWRPHREAQPIGTIEFSRLYRAA